MAEDTRNEIDTGGGAYADGNVQTGGGAFVGRDQYIQYNQLDITKLADALRQVLPAGDPSPELWVEALKDLRGHHTRLFEWKELHNYLNDVLVAIAPLKREIESIKISREEPNARNISRYWRPVKLKVSAMLEWSADIKFISEKPFTHTEEQSEGPSWAIDLYSGKKFVDELLDRPMLDTNEVYDAIFDFSSIAEEHMFRADRKLRASAGELYILSSIVLGKLSHE